MSHYRSLDPAVKARARDRGIDLEKSTDDFLESIRNGTGMRRDLAARLNGLLTGPPMSLVEATDEWFAERRAA